MKYFFISDKGKKSLIDAYDETAKPVLKKANNRSVIKIVCGDKYIVTKCGSIEWLCKELDNSISRYRVSVSSKSIYKGLSKDSLYYKFIKYCIDNDIKELELSVLFSSENGYDVLKFELEFLTINFGKRECLNINNIPYIPKTIHAKKGSNWLTQNQYLNIMKLLKKYEY